MLQIVWSDEARGDLRSLIEYIAPRNPIAARRMKALLDEAILPAVEHPYLFRPGRVAGTREIVVHPNYILVYQVGDGALVVLRVLHARQQYP
jgi:toxin ParE1/3/4